MKEVREWVRQRGKKEKREKRQSGWERPSVVMETGSHQLTPCFPLVPHPPPTPFIFPPGPFIFPLLQPHLSFPPSIFFFVFLSLYHNHTSFTFPPTPSLSVSIRLPLSGIYRSLHQPHPRCLTLSSFHWLYFYPLTVAFFYFSSPRGCADKNA